MSIELETYNGRFKVKRSWLRKYLRTYYGMTIRRFLRAYDWDDSKTILEDAEIEKKVVGKILPVQW